MNKSSSKGIISSELNVKVIKKLLTKRYIEYWTKSIQTKEGKLKTYKTFKNNFIQEPYLKIKDTEARKCLARLRTSAHSLEIERGRYTRPKTPVNNRICEVCKKDVGTEVHFLLSCPNLSIARGTHLQKIGKLAPNFMKLNEYDKFRFLMTSDDEILQITCNLVKSLDKLRTTMIDYNITPKVGKRKKK